MASGVSENSLCRPTDDSSESSESLGECDLEDTITASHRERGAAGDHNSRNYSINGLESFDADQSLIHAPKIFTAILSKIQDNTLKNIQKQSIKVEIFGLIHS